MSSDEKWTAEVHSALMTLDGMARTSYQQQALRTIKDALMVGGILDAEGDGGAVGDAADLLVSSHARQAPDELYQNACESVESWKARALEAEESNDRLVEAMNDITGPTFMGEPMLAAAPPAPEKD